MAFLAAFILNRSGDERSCPFRAGIMQHGACCGVHVGTVFAGPNNTASDSRRIHRQVDQLSGQRFATATGHFKLIKIFAAAAFCRGVFRQLLPIGEEHPRPVAARNLEPRFTTSGFRGALSSINLDSFPPRHIAHVEVFGPTAPDDARTIVRNSVPGFANSSLFIATVYFITKVGIFLEWVWAALCVRRLAVGQHADELQLPPGPCLLYTSDAADDLLCVDLC